MAQGLLGDFQPQGVGYGNILMDEPVQYGLDEGFGALAGSLRNVIIDPVLGTLSDVGNVMGDIRSGRPVGMSRLQDVSQRAAMDLTGTNLIAGLPERIAAAQAGQVKLGSGGGKIRAFHGSPHHFDKFSTSKIGTGEGNQAFGEGLYFADVEKTAKSYRDEGVFKAAQSGQSPIMYKGKPFKFLGDVAEAETPEYEALSSIVNIMRRRGISAEEAQKQKIKSLESEKKRYDQAGTNESDVGFIDLGDGQSLEGLLAQSTQGLLDSVKSINPSDIKKAKGAMYEVEIDATLEELIDYDKPLGKQSPEVKAMLDKATDDLTVDDAVNLGFDPFEMRGKDIEKQAINKAKQSLLDPENSVESFLNTLMSVKGTSGAGEDLLKQQGAKGIKYYDADARGTAGGSLIDTFKDADGFRAKVAVDGRTGYFGDRGRIVTTSPPFKTEKEALDWAEEATSRATRNYVIFDDNLIDIIKKYGFIPPVIGGASLLSSEPSMNEMSGDEMLRAGIL